MKKIFTYIGIIVVLVIAFKAYHRWLVMQVADGYGLDVAQVQNKGCLELMKMRKALKAKK